MADVVITGASSGVGYATAKRLAESGAHRVVAIARRARELAQLSATTGDAPGQVIPLVGDIADREAFPELLDAIGDALPRVDVLINNAGTLHHAPFAELSDADWRRHFEVNLFGPVRLIRGLLPRMATESPAHIVNISSMGGFQGSAKFAGLSAYSGSKAALANLTECLAEEFGAGGPRVNCVCLGAVQTEMLAQAFPGYQAPIDAATFAEFLADFALNGHRYCNGKILPMALTTP